MIPLRIHSTPQPSHIFKFKHKSFIFITFQSAILPRRASLFVKSKGSLKLLSSDLPPRSSYGPVSTANHPLIGSTPWKKNKGLS
jgi:hypothetical protein